MSEKIGEAEEKGHAEPSESYPNLGINDSSKDDSIFLNGGENEGVAGGLSQSLNEVAAMPPTLTIVISQPEESRNPKSSFSNSIDCVRDDKIGVAVVESVKKGFLSGCDISMEECRVCQQQTEEQLIDLGCSCRGELAKAHRSCIEMWFRTKGSNKCEICLQVAANVPLPDPLLSTNYCISSIDSAYDVHQQARERRCISPLCVAFSILVGGLLLDVLISVSLGVSALPVNVIVGILIILGLGTGLRIAVGCCQEWGVRTLHGANLTINPRYYPTV